MDIAKLAILIVAAIAVVCLAWLFIELAITMRSTRKAMKEMTERIEPTLAHIEQITSSLEPAVARIDPLLERVSLTVDAVNLEIMRVDAILEDVTEVTGAVGGTAKKLSSVKDAPGNLLSGAAGKINRVISKKKDDAKTASASEQLSKDDQPQAPAEDEEAMGVEEEAAAMASEEVAQLASDDSITENEYGELDMEDAFDDDITIGGKTSEDYFQSPLA